MINSSTPYNIALNIKERAAFCFQALDITLVEMWFTDIPSLAVSNVDGASDYQEKLIGCWKAGERMMENYRTEVKHSSMKIK